MLVILALIGGVLWLIRKRKNDRPRAVTPRLLFRLFVGQYRAAHLTP
ncbi:MAG: LPXTG cell wall anchor domain-containing protein [Alicyclobacillus herbarius]|nr:LPXTG cell wall anchor domain-containing protein [Alicyclobacillus herbarius]